MREWLTGAGCTHVGMESTGIYWRPVYQVLEDQFELVVGNARHMKNVPGRKTDVKDSEWIADLLRHGLIKKSFVPPKPIRQLRDLVRYRVKLVGSRSSERNRLLALLETANIKISGVATDAFGVSGMAMLNALAKGKSTPEHMAQLARGKLRKKIPQLEAALHGSVDEQHRFQLGIQLERLNAIERDIAWLEGRLEEKLEPYRAQHALLMQIPGVDRVVAASLIAELGVDMGVFLNAYHLASWAGVTKNLVTRLERLGYRVTLERPAPAPAPPLVDAVPTASAG